MINNIQKKIINNSYIIHIIFTNLFSVFIINFIHICFPICKKNDIIKFKIRSDCLNNKLDYKDD
jgi:hypothetical protein